MNSRYNLNKCVAVTAVAILVAASCCFGSVLSVPQYDQEKTQWCWNASAQMVLAFKGYSYSQTTIANWAVGGQNIPNYLYGSTDASMHGDDEILSHFGNISSTGSASAMSLSSLGTEMANSRPVMIRWGWDGGGGHILVARGTDGNSVYINDPWNGQSINSYSWVCQSGGHTWTHTLQLSGGSSYYQYYQYYYNLAVQRYNSASSYLDLAYAYNYYAYAMYYGYMYNGDSSSANYYYNLYKQTAQDYYRQYYSQWYQYYYNLASDYYDYYYYTGSYYYLAYCYYNYAYAAYCRSMYNGDSSSANYYYSFYMNYAAYFYDLYTHGY